MIAYYHYEDDRPVDDDNEPFELVRRSLKNELHQVALEPPPLRSSGVPVSRTIDVTDDDFEDEITSSNGDLVEKALERITSNASTEEVKAWREFASKQVRPDGRYHFRRCFFSNER